MSIRKLLDLGSVDDYATFLRVKSLPKWSMEGRTLIVPDEYADVLGTRVAASAPLAWTAPEWMFDYQRDITRLAIQKRKFAVFADCGLGKTPILLAFADHAAKSLKGTGRKVLIVSPLMVVRQTIGESARFFGHSPTSVAAKDLAAWLRTPGEGVGITNYDAIHEDLPSDALGGLVLDESSMLKSHYGAWGTALIQMGRGLEWKLCCTGTPAPNDRIEYANHAVFLDAFPTVNSFLARFFVNRGETSNRWELKPHALRPFYRALSHWCIFLTNPAVYGWAHNAGDIPPIHVHVHEVSLTDQQRTAAQETTGMLMATETGGIGQRSVLGQLAKGKHKGERIPTNKLAFIRSLVESWPDEQTIVWCLYNDEQDRVAELFPDCANIDGETPYERRMELLDDFKAGRRRILVTKPRILGFGVNLQHVTRQVFSGLQDSYESYYQAVKRSNRYGSTKPLHVHIPTTELERPMIQTVLEKRDRVLADTQEQERLFRETGVIHV